MRMSVTQAIALRRAEGDCSIQTSNPLGFKQFVTARLTNP
jgi:hypothetical protein